MQKMGIKIALRVKRFAVVFAAILALWVPSAAGWACRDTCGSIEVKYPFGTGPGCGDPRFVKYVGCVNEQLIFTTHTGSYNVQSIDYDKTLIYINDSSMSSCSAMQKSASFGLDWAAPFKFKNDVFVLFGCSTSSSLYDPKNYLCDTGSAHICNSLYSCPAVQRLGIPQFSSISTCCVYAPINLGSADGLNLPKLGCSSYTSIYSFGDDPTDPTHWKYGVALLYSYNVDNSNFPSACGVCQQSNGVCGFTGMYNTFVCVCRNGVNTTTDCSGQEYYWSGTHGDKSAFKLWIEGFVYTVGVLLCTMVWQG